MEIKEIRPINFLFYRAETKVTELADFLPIGQELFREAVRLNIPITGPVHWHYFGFDGNENNSFTLEVSLPVGAVEEDYDGKFHFKRTESFKCVSILHAGSWMDIPKSYEKIFQFVNEKKLKPLSSNREIYVNTDFQNPDANITEIQIGIS